ncbi:MAG: PEP-CTERM sorting domain-containing protein [Planctomycetota bacterium]
MSLLFRRSAWGIAALVLSVSMGSGIVAQDTYLEKDGLLVLEAEAASNIPTNHWAVDSSVAGASGGSYLRAKTNSFGNPGRGTISYNFQTTSTGNFQFNFRSRIGQGTSNTEHNDTWVRLVDRNGNAIAPIANNNDVRSGRWMKAYRNGNVSQWISQASNRDNDPHSISWSLQKDTEYAIQLSSRSAGHLVDRLYLWDRSRYNFANQNAGWGANENALNNLTNSGLVPEPGTAALSLGVMGWLLLRRRQIAG